MILFLVIVLYLIAAVSLATMFIPRNPAEPTSYVVAFRVGQITRIVVLVLSAIFLTQAYLVG